MKLMIRISPWHLGQVRGFVSYKLQHREPTSRPFGTAQDRYAFSKFVTCLAG
jgi:hypothetical protein